MWRGAVTASCDLSPLNNTGLSAEKAKQSSKQMPTKEKRCMFYHLHISIETLQGYG